MEENYALIAQERPCYYVSGSPVQLVYTEQLQGDQTGEYVVCLTFKNISPVTITRFDISVSCKDENGNVICAQEFSYRDLEVATGELFGMDDCVASANDKIAVVDIALEKVYSGKKVMLLNALERVALPALEPLEPALAQALSQRMGHEGLVFMPSVYEHGWHCACGAFHPEEERTVYCSECKSDRILLQNSLQALVQPKTPAQHHVDPTRVIASDDFGATRVHPHEAETVHAFSTEHDKAPVAESEDKTIRMPAKVASERVAHSAEATRRVSSAQEQTRNVNIKKFAQQYEEDVYGEEEGDYEEESYDPRDELAENLIRWVPALTALLCAMIAIGGFLYCQVIL